MHVESRKNSISIASEIIGHKWTAEILYALSLSPQRFCQIQRSAGGVNPRTLSARLDDLEKEKIISRQPMQDCAGDQYQLEKKGLDLLPAIRAMTDWGKK
ncbi:helix-turn-helix transcriptional regulator [Candidatus Saccharibacteria bacterium]|nr:helix-turn-helix transcriptional regulator [Candidatus Saccharibacteria bacterium]